MMTPADIYDFIALPATGAYVPTPDYEVVDQVGDELHFSAQLRSQGKLVAELRKQHGLPVRAEWSSAATRIEYLRWAEGLQMLQTKPAGSSYYSVGLHVLCAEAAAQGRCNKLAESGFVYTRAADLTRGEWFLEELLDPANPDDRAFLRFVDPDALYLWADGRRQALRPGDERLLPEFAA
ncbi:MAG: hypothetical protein WA988_20440 [Candidatus Nanopelagicales bacterium]